MSDTVTSPNMNLPVPVVSTDFGPDWANNLNSCLGAIDSHTHIPGQGVQITPAGININSALPMNNYSLTAVSSMVFQSQSSLATLKALYVISNDIYYNDGAGNVVRITQGGSVTGATGTITGLPSGTASASYESVGGTFVFQSSTNTPANISAATVKISEQTTSPNFISLKSPTSLASSYNVTFPGAVPAASSFVMMATTGTLSTRAIKVPTVQKLTSGTAATYTTPSGVLYLKVRLVGGGGGGAGADRGSGATAGSTGGDTTFSDGSLTLTGSGGVGGGATTGGGGAGGAASVSSGTALLFPGGGGGGQTVPAGTVPPNTVAGAGGSSMLGGGAASPSGGTGNPGIAAVANTGGGGSAASIDQNPSARAGGSGGGGGGVDMIIGTPAATYTYTVGSGGAAGSGSGGGQGGGAGGSGIIYVEEHYQ